MPYPENESVFELTIDGEARKNQPLGMVETVHGGSEGWKHRGEVVKGKQTRRFKLVYVGCCANLDEVISKLLVLGPIPEGQWIRAFHACFPQPDSKGPVGVADHSWVTPDGDLVFPSVNAEGELDFAWPRYHRRHWRWLMGAE
jgi:hypothetical protein